MAVATSTALLIGAAAVSVIGGTIGAYSGFAQADAAKRSGEFNARLAERNAALAAQAGQRQADQIAQRGRRLRGAQLARLGKRGVTVSGSAIDVIQDSEKQIEDDALAALYRGGVEAEGARLQGQYARQAARSQANASRISGVGSLISGLGSGASAVAGIDFGE